MAYGPNIPELNRRSADYVDKILKAKVGLVVSPLIALMADQVSALQQSGVAAEKLDSNTGLDTRGDIWRLLPRFRAAGAFFRHRLQRLVRATRAACAETWNGGGRCVPWTDEDD